MLSRQSVLYGGDEISSSFIPSGGGEGREPRIKDTTPPCPPNNNNSNPDSNKTRLCVRSEQFSPCLFSLLSLFSGSPSSRASCAQMKLGGTPAGEPGAACELPGLNPGSPPGRAAGARRPALPARTGVSAAPAGPRRPGPAGPRPLFPAPKAEPRGGGGGGPGELGKERRAGSGTPPTPAARPPGAQVTRVTAGGRGTRGGGRLLV